MHFTRATSGTVEAGPNAVLALKREGYQKSDFSFDDSAALLTYAGFWKMASEHWKTGVSEMAPLAQQGGLRPLASGPHSRDHGRRSRAGTRRRPRAGGRRERQARDDFRLIAAEAMLHVLNAPSPAATASIAIGRHLAAAATRTFR